MKIIRRRRTQKQSYHDDVMGREKKCLGCKRCFNLADDAVFSRIEKHHHCYLRLCNGQILSEDSEDIYKPAKNSEFPHVPDCRQYKIDHPEYYEGCIKKIFPVHSQCHEDIHEVESHLFAKLGKKLQADFLSTASDHRK